ncbi:hypothetical protein Tco_1412787, partial [Tanacetum coccineum]
KEYIEENKSKTITKEIAIESSSESQEVFDSQITKDQKFYEDRGLESVSNFDTNFYFKEGLQPSTSKADTGNNNVTRDDTLDIVIECHDRQDSESTAEHQHDETQNITSDIPEQQKDEESETKQNNNMIQTITSYMPKQQKEESKDEKQHDKIQYIMSDTPEQPKYIELEAKKHHHEIQYVTSDMPKQQKDEDSKAKKQHHENKIS